MTRVGAGLSFWAEGAFSSGFWPSWEGSPSSITKRDLNFLNMSELRISLILRCIKCKNTD